MTGVLSAVVVSGMMQAQVRDVSVTISPFVEYNWWNDNIALKDSPFWGARVGFGFGPYFELRGTLEKSLNLKNALEGKSWNPLNQETLDKLDGMDIDITRIGGEAKLNIFGNSAFSPFVTAGTGVQIFDYTPFGTGNVDNAIANARVKERQIYMSLGLGMKMALSDRMAFSLEAKNIRFNMDADNSYIDPSVADKDKRWGNWAAVASIDFYLGNNATARDSRYGSAYRNIFNDGFKGPKFVVEPGIAFVDFSSKSHHTDQWFVGGSAGIDLSSLVGIRGFYYQATKEPSKLDLNFNDNMKMYGANIIARLNYPRGIVPYLSLGAGYMQSEGSQLFRKNDLFALAGAGIEVPVSKYIALFGTYSAMLTTDREVINDVTKVQSPSELINNNMYTAGVRFNLGVSASTPVYGETSRSDADFVNERINDTRSVEEHINQRGDTRDYTPASERTVPKAEVSREKAAKTPSDRMTKREFEEMVERILDKIRKEERERTALMTKNETTILLSALGEEKAAKATTKSADNSELVTALQEISKKLDRNHNEMMSTRRGSATTTIVTPVAGSAKSGAQGTHTVQDPTVYNTNIAAPAKASFLSLNRLAVLAGPSFGEHTLLNVDLRGYMQVSNTSFDFVPEVFIGFGPERGYGLSGNVLYNINLGKESKFTPYAGLGLGIFNHGNKTTAGSNIIVGANINTIAGGAFFVDFSARNLFKNNQLAVGYRFVF